HKTRCSDVCSMFIALFALRRIIQTSAVVTSFCHVPLATLHCRYKIFLLHSFTYHTAVYFDRNLGLIIAIGLASITGFVKKKVCREKVFVWEGKDTTALVD